MQKHIHGGDIYSRTYKMDFSANINPLGMPESAVNAAIEGVRMSQNYPDVNCRRLKRQSVKQNRFRKNGLFVAMEPQS